MSTDQLENPPEHAGTAPHGEIRDRPRAVLRPFTAVMAAALVLPVVVLIVVGIDLKRTDLLTAGIILLILWAIVVAILLWKMITSRETHIVEAEETERAYK